MQQDIIYNFENEVTYFHLNKFCFRLHRNIFLAQLRDSAIHTLKLVKKTTNVAHENKVWYIVLVN